MTTPSSNNNKKQQQQPSSVALQDTQQGLGSANTVAVVSTVVKDPVLPNMSIGRQPSRNIPGPKCRTGLGRWFNLVSYLGNPVKAHLALAANQDGKTHFVSPTEEKDAAFVLGISREAMADLTLNEADHWMRPKFGPLKLQEGSKQDHAGSSLSTNNGKEWKGRRDVVKGGFKPKSMVDAFSAAMRENMKPVVRDLVESNGAPQSMLLLARRVCLKNLATVVFGVESFPSWMDKRVETFLKKVVHPATIALQYDVWPLPYHSLCKSLRMLYDWAAELISAKRETPDDSVASMMANKRGDDGELTPVDRLVGDLVVLYITGRDGPAAAVAWTLFLLATHPQHQEFLARELHDTRDGGDRPYLGAVLNESMRVLPGTFLLNPRLCSKDGEYAGVHVPRGAMAFGSILARHHDPNVWENPRVFNPSRWLAPGFKPDAFDFMPFGQGPRRCVGDAFGMAELREAVVSIVSECTVEVDHGKTYTYVADAIIIAPHKKNTLRFTRRVPMDFAHLYSKVKVHGNVNDVVDLDLTRR